ncbi:MAG: hypothetical protein LC713_00215 [Actinobacteria bacterium]|nr:hypothetical protein [Actinomycetota bacterium]
MSTARPEITDQSDPLARTAKTRRVGLAAAMFAAPWFIVAAETGHSIANPTGKDDIDPAVALAIASNHTTLLRWSSFAALVGAMLLVPAVMGVMRLVRTRAARLGLVAGVLTAAGYICYFALVLQGAFTETAMATTGGSTSQNVDVLRAVMDDPLGVGWVGPAFVLGNIVGTFLLGLALIRARTAGRWAGYGLIAWSVLHVLAFSPWVEVVGAAAQALGLAVAATALLREGRQVAEGTRPYELLRR